MGQKYQLIDQGVNQFGTDVALQSQTAAAKFAEAQAQMSDAMIKLGAAMLPLVETVMPKLVTAVTDLANWFTNLPKPAQDVILAFLGILAILGPLLVLFGSLLTVIGILTTGFTLVAPVIVAAGATILALGAPLLIVIGVVALLAIAIYTHWNQIIDWTSNLMLTIATLWNKGWTGISNFFDSMWSGLKSAIQRAINFIEGMLNGLFSTVSSITSNIMAPIQAITGAVSGVGSMLGGGASSMLSMVPHFANGGIVTGPTMALVGEAGPEAIIPLSAFAGGGSLRGAGGSSGNIVVNIMGGNYLNSNGATMIANAIGKQVVQQLRLMNFS